MTLILASKSEGRAMLLREAGLAFDVVPAPVDEDAAKMAYVEAGLSPRDLADALAELKAVAVSIRHPHAMVIGCDQVLACGDARFDKPISRDEAADQLGRLAGRTHHLFSAVVIAEGGRVTWRHVETATLTMRALAGAEIAAYLDGEWPAIAACVGGYRIEGAGRDLFDRVEGDRATIIGLPIARLTTHLARRGVMAA